MVSVQPEFEIGQIPGVAMIKAVRRAAEGNYVAVMIEQGEAVAVLEGAQPAFLKGNDRGDIELRGGFGLRRIGRMGLLDDRRSP